MNIIQAKLKDSLLATGVGLIPISLLIFCIPFFFRDSENFFGVFMVNFIISVAYFFILLFNKKIKIGEHKRHYTFLLLILLLISAYSLNREMTVFNTSPAWLCGVLIILSVNYILSIFSRQLPDWIKLFQFFLMGIAIVLFFYLSIYLLPLYFISTIGLIVFGIAIHTYVPLLFSIYTCLLVNDLSDGKRKYWASFGCGIVTVIAIVISYTLTWSADKKKINQAYVMAVAEGTDDLPAWIQVAQRINHNSFTEKILKTDLVYAMPDWNDNFLWSIPQRNLGEQQKIHDPLIIMASLFSGKIHLSENDRINILKSQFGARHHAEERLWTGKDLSTQNVISSVRVWPEFHLAYTEKIITVFNHSISRWMGNQQEGIYTFHLPEGAVATSLSLWINGKEEKGILTTKEKADGAYTGIVGVESRDPSMIHWQEGNRITVRVFPVMSNDSRRFKVGITSPLRKEGDQLVYDIIWFVGTDACCGEDTVRFYLNGVAPG
ncbi:MAG: XrtN system VIT domain-containing protein, partial [Bacteroidota bacterium]|nr:XrtN system VIT domain-containing protein [Bacteroidota bacterium]